MARQIHNRNISQPLAAAQQWTNVCLVADGSLFSQKSPGFNWIESVPQKGFDNFDTCCRYFAVPDRVERVSSNRDRWSVLEAFGVAAERETKHWTDRQLDDALLKLRGDLTEGDLSEVLELRSQTAGTLGARTKS